MTAFRYRAARADGAAVHGVLEAPTDAEVAAALSARGLYPLSVRPARASSSGWRSRPSAGARAVVFQSLAALVDAGVPLEKALVATERVATGRLHEALDRIAGRVREGSSLGTALRAEGGLFSGVTIGLVRAGERGVGLGTALAQAASQLEREAETAARIRGALAYPLLLAVVGCLSVGVIVLFVVPRFAALLADVGQTLPVATRLLIGASGLARRFGLLVGGTLGVAAAFGLRLVAERKATCHAWLLGLPLIGPIRHRLSTARVARTLGALLGSGTPAMAALATAAEAAGDACIAERLERARAEVSEGVPLSAAIASARPLTATAGQLIAIGEASGRLPALLAKAAELEEREAERRLRILVGFLEPALILAFAAIVAFVAAALLQAVYSLRPGGV